MTSRLTPRQKEDVLSLWKTRGYDTTHIAERLSLSESAVYAAVSARAAKPKPAPVKASYAARPRRPEREKSIVRQVAPQPKPKAPAPRQYRLIEGGYYLHQSGKSKTADLSLAWKGDAVEAVDCCAKFPIAKNMMMELIS